MGVKISSVQITPTAGISGIKRIDAQLKALILSAEATIPGSRGFGLSREFISRPPMEARNILAMELEERCEEFVPEVSIADVDMDYNLDGTLNLQIHVERRE